MKYQEINGDLIELSRKGKFDIIAHGCNCFNTQTKGIALSMAKTFHTDTFTLENKFLQGDIRKLGSIDAEEFQVSSMSIVPKEFTGPTTSELKYDLTVINCYTQFRYGKGLQLDYEALTLCLRKINHIYKGLTIGLPKIGAGLAGGDWNKIKTIIQTELKDMSSVIIVCK